MLVHCFPRYKKRGFFFFFHLYLTANNDGTAEKMQCNQCREATASQMMSCILASLTSKTSLLGVNRKTQTFRDIIIFFWTAELQRWSQDTSASPDILAVLQLWLTSKASPTEINYAKWCQQNHRVLPTKTRTHRPKAVPVTHRQSLATTFCNNLPHFQLVYLQCFTSLLQVISLCYKEFLLSLFLRMPMHILATQKYLYKRTLSSTSHPPFSGSQV